MCLWMIESSCLAAALATSATSLLKVKQIIIPISIWCLVLSEMLWHQEWNDLVSPSYAGASISPVYFFITLLLHYKTSQAISKTKTLPVYINTTYFIRVNFDALKIAIVSFETDYYLCYDVLSFNISQYIGFPCALTFGELN